MPHRMKMMSSTRAPSAPSANRLAIAQLPAKAAPNTSALIKIAALATVSTLPQRMRRGRGDAVLLMASRGVPGGFLRQQPGFDQGCADAVDLGAADLDQRR